MHTAARPGSRPLCSHIKESRCSVLFMSPSRLKLIVCFYLQTISQGGSELNSITSGCARTTKLIIVNVLFFIQKRGQVLSSLDPALTQQLHQFLLGEILQMNTVSICLMPSFI